MTRKKDLQLSVKVDLIEQIKSEFLKNEIYLNFCTDQNAPLFMRNSDLLNTQSIFALKSLISYLKSKKLDYKLKNEIILTNEIIKNY